MVHTKESRKLKAVLIYIKNGDGAGYKQCYSPPPPYFHPGGFHFFSSGNIMARLTLIHYIE
jgi:hypothetical protein